MVATRVVRSVYAILGEVTNIPPKGDPEIFWLAKVN